MLVRTVTAAFAAASLAATVPAAAQIQAGNLVNVNVSQVMIEDILSDNQITANVTAPITVQLPISVAANVCNVDVSVLAQRGKGDKTATCDAQSRSDALNQQVIRVFSAQQQQARICE